MLKLLDAGVLTTIQDAGRWGYQADGVPVSGAMDWFAFSIANQLVGNAPSVAAFETHSPIALQTDTQHLVALTGAEAALSIDGRAAPMWSSVFVRANSVVEINPRRAGGWNYLAVRGGVDVSSVLGSRATFLRGGFGGFDGRALQTGDAVPIGKTDAFDLAVLAGRVALDRVRAFAKRQSPIRVVLGPHGDWFAPDAIDTFTTSEYTLTDTADRMGYRFAGVKLNRARNAELISCGVPLGAIQIPSDGQPIVLMADHQTTGGYPMIATVIRADLPIVAQCRPGEPIRFCVVKLDQAQTANRELASMIEI
jgi:biotin-dependent carboxylase-like uncharacterized protein